MDVLVAKCLEFGFIRVSISSSKPQVIHCVPGAGKSSLIRAILRADSRFYAVTGGVPDPVTGQQGRILPLDGTAHPGACFKLVDEYTEAVEAIEGAFAIFGDPVQSKRASPLLPNFISLNTRRFGSSTCDLLKVFGFEVYSTKEDVVQIARADQSEVEGKLIVLGDEAKALACYYNLEYLTADSARGKTYPVVTLLTGFSEVPAEEYPDLYVCLTRHQEKLLVLTGDASCTPA
ncbi:triple gene block protein 1 [Butterbur mosaic virus]|uniref:Triple gene block protein 1 n=1 Tax=Butterbur mosaic virus TaxID=666859 RepID=D2Z043_9VIRU|nr:triple gene block protein 1 [Butterbur mosaic virus]BAI49693.1 triple gene block protein 1 [Butterbur mosaic virus]